MTERKVDLTEQVRKMQLDAAWLAGQSYEREAIVAWLREYDSRHPGFQNMRVTRNVANDIERGEHLRGNDE